MDLWDNPLPAGIIEQKLVQIMSDIMKTSLSEHEEVAYPGPTFQDAPRPVGGHTLKKHAGKSDAELLARFTWDPLCSVSSGFFHNVSFAEAIVAKALLSNLGDVYNWYTGSKARTAELSDAGEDDADLVIVYHNNFPIGRSFRHDKQDKPAKLKSKITIKLRWIKDDAPLINGRNDFILTAFPC